MPKTTRRKAPFGEIRRLQIEGYPQWRIAQILGISQSYLSVICKKDEIIDYRFRAFKESQEGMRYWQGEDEIEESLNFTVNTSELVGWEMEVFSRL